MPNDLNKQFLKGLQSIEDVIDAECRVQGIAEPMVRHDGRGSPHRVMFSIQVNGRKVETPFTGEEVRDSAEGLNPLVRANVRAFVTRARARE